MCHVVKRTQIPEIGEPVGLFRHDSKRLMESRSCRGRGASHWHGTPQFQICMPTPMSATLRYPQLTFSLWWPLKQLAPGTIRQLSWARKLGRRATDRHHPRETSERPPTCSSSYLSGFAKAELTRSLFTTHSQPASRKPVIYFFASVLYI